MFPKAYIVNMVASKCCHGTGMMSNTRIVESTCVKEERLRMRREYYGINEAKTKADFLMPPT